MTLQPPRTALLVIDVQTGFDEIEASGADRNNPDAVARIGDLLAAFRQVGWPVVHVRHESTNPESVFAAGRPGRAAKPEAGERPGETVLTKRQNSAFEGTDLRKLLVAAGTERLVLCGATTNHCVETTARVAGNAGFEVWFVRDGTWTFDRIGPDGDRHAAADLHAATLANLHGEFARIVTTAEVVATLEECG